MGEETRDPKPETLRDIYELVKGSLDRQADEGQMLDSKMVQVFSAASVVAGLAGLSVSGGAPTDAGGAVLLALALVAYAGVAYAALRHLAPVSYWVLNYPDIWRKSWSDEPSELHHSVIAKVVDNYARNDLLLRRKAVTIRLATAATGAEVVLVGLALSSALFG
jgi:hypothetical protein